jgi:endonuclease/exonuclease/phosphatase family metal-dependent hydrolase
MNLISANIRFDNPLDNENAWKNRRTLLAKCLKEFEPDIVGTQEGRKDQLKDLSSLLTNLKMADSHRNWIPERMYPTIFYNPKTVTLKETGDIWLSKTPYEDGSKDFDSLFPRLFTYLKGTHEEKEFFLVNVHLDHLKETTRASQIKVLLEELKKKAPARIILLGDFNEGPTGMVRAILKRELPDIYDPWIKLSFPEEGSHHKFKGILEDAQRIDWILLDKSISCENIFFDKSNENGIYPSDHFPLKAQIILK